MDSELTILQLVNLFMFQLFFEYALNSGILTAEECSQLFPNLKKVLNLHRELHEAFVELKKQDGDVVKLIGDALLSRVRCYSFLLHESSAY